MNIYSCAKGLFPTHQQHLWAIPLKLFKSCFTSGAVETKGEFWKLLAAADWPFTELG